MTAPSSAPDDQTAADLEAIEEVIATIQRTQRAELVDEFVSLFRDDAIWTTAHGLLLSGRDEIATFTQKVLPGAMKEMTGSTFEIVQVLFIRPDVAAVKVRQRYLTASGEPTAEGDGTPLFVMAKEDGVWLLTACQNTKVLAD
jgi:uncharacterized protein (TIGR02246 family)